MHAVNITNILGSKEIGKMAQTSPMSLMELSQKGVSKGALLRLANYLKFSESQMAELLPVTRRTIQRYSRGQRFNRFVSESILQIAEVAARGVEVFGDKKKFISWLKHPHPAFGNQTPTSLLISRFGSEMVLDELGRMEHGVIS